MKRNHNLINTKRKEREMLMKEDGRSGKFFNLLQIRIKLSNETGEKKDMQMINVEVKKQ